METVGAIGAVVGRDDLRGVERQGELVDLFLTAYADTLSASLDDVSGIEVHLLGLQVKVAAEGVIDGLHLRCPFGVAGVRLALMHQYALDDAVLLGFPCQGDEASVGVVAVGFEHALHPAGCLVRHVVGYFVLHEAFNLDAADGHVDDADLDMLGQRGDQRPPEPVGGRQTGAGTTERRHSLAPLAHTAPALGIVDGGHQQETRTRTTEVLRLGLGGALHVRLSKTQENVEVGVNFGTHLHETHDHEQQRQNTFHKNKIFYYEFYEFYELFPCGDGFARRIRTCSLNVKR